MTEMGILTEAVFSAMAVVVICLLAAIFYEWLDGDE